MGLGCDYQDGIVFSITHNVCIDATFTRYPFQNLNNMKAKLKLICPVCRGRFTTSQPQKIYCSAECREKRNQLIMQVDENYRKQERFADDRYRYDFDKDVFCLKSFWDRV